MAKVTSGLPGAGYVGKFGNAVFYRVGEETLMRERVVPANPRTPAQTQGRASLGEAARAWGRLTDAEFAAWEAAGGYRAFVGLTRKWLQMNPGGIPPTMPPAGPFMGNSVRLGLAIGEGSIAITADRANSAGVVTEMLLQRVAHARRKPGARSWRSAGFFAFTEAGRSVSLPCGKGTFLVAYRFVEAATGQAGDLAVVGAVTMAS